MAVKRISAHVSCRMTNLLLKGSFFLLVSLLFVAAGLHPKEMAGTSFLYVAHDFSPLVRTTPLMTSLPLQNAVRRLPSFSVDTRGTPKGEFELAVTGKLELRNTSHELFLYRALPVAYDRRLGHSVLADPNQLTGGKVEWALRVLAYLRKEDPDYMSPTGETWAAVPEAWWDLRVGMVLWEQGEGVEAAGQSAGDTNAQPQVISNCKVDAGDYDAVLLLECPLPESAWAWFEEVLSRPSAVLGADVMASDSALGKITPQLELPLSLRAEDTSEKSVGLAMCLAPVFGPQDDRRWVEWIEYHRHAIQVEHFYIYVASTVSSQALHWYEREGIVTVISYNTIASWGASWNMSRGHYDQKILFNDCLMRNRYQAKWVATLDLDEYLVVPPVEGVPDGRSLKTLLARTFQHAGALRLHRFLIAAETNSSSPLMIGKRVVREADDSVGKHFYWDVKSIVNPMRVRTCWLHFCKQDHEQAPPGEGAYLDEYHVPVGLAWVGHYRYANGPMENDTAFVDVDSRHVKRWVPVLTPLVDQVLERLAVKTVGQAQ